jgi:hypothetical protein
MNEDSSLLDAFPDILDDLLEMLQNICRFDIIHQNLQRLHAL